MTGNIELLSPAGEFATALAAFSAGADAVYLGMSEFSARASAVNFTPEELSNIIAVARKLGKKVYVTFNTLLTDAELQLAVERLAILAAIKPDALIVQDLGVARLIRRHFPELTLHASTQLVAHNLEGVLALKDCGFTRVVLARELSLADIRSIARRCGCELEVFVHGALCYSVSGLCLFSAMEKNRSGNRGRCAYCCRVRYEDASGESGFPFSMKDLRLDDRLEELREAGVASLKIEGRMKNALYVSAVTKHYRDILDGAKETVSRADLETVFSRKTTRLYADGYDAKQVIDPVNLGNLGAEIGVVKRITRDREDVKWLRFHTSRALEKYDGIQISVTGKGRPIGFSIGDMRTALSRHNTFAVPAGADIEVRVPDDFEAEVGATIYCGASGAVKRRFPAVAWRPSDYPSGKIIEVVVTLSAKELVARCGATSVTLSGTLEPAKDSAKTTEAVRRAFGKLGGTGFQCGMVEVVNPEGLFAPASILNELRRVLVKALTVAQTAAQEQRIATIRTELVRTTETKASVVTLRRVLKLRIDQKLPTGKWDEVIVDVGHNATIDSIVTFVSVIPATIRLALPIFTLEANFNKLRNRVKALMRVGYKRWEVADLAGLRMLRLLGVTDITADWSLYAFNTEARNALRELGVARMVRSPEAPLEDKRETDYEECMKDELEWLEYQSTPLFISLTRPAIANPSYMTGWNGESVTSWNREGLWITTKLKPRIFKVPEGMMQRTDLSWDPAEDGSN